MSGDQDEPTRPILRYREDCSFAKHWALRAQQRCGTSLVLATETDLTTGHFLTLQLPDGRIFHDLSAIIRVYSEFEDNSWALRLQFLLPNVFQFLEWILRFLLIRHADVLILPLRAAADYATASQLFIRAVGLIYLLSFLGALPQMPGLVGEHGILPMESFPYLQWQGVAADRTMLGTCLLGALAGMGMLLRLCPFVSAVSAYFLYSLLMTAGGEFFAFTFDYYILEIGFLAILVAPFIGRQSKITAPPRILIWYIWWLLFRLFFFPLLNYFSNSSGDFSPAQMRYDLMCQPLPTPVSWWIFQTPPWLLTFLNSLSTTISIIALLTLLAGRRWRPIAGFSFLLLILWGLMLGNGSLGPWLTASLCLFCFDESWFGRFRSTPSLMTESKPPSLWRPVTIGTLAVFLWILSFLFTAEGYGCALPASAEAALRWTSSWRVMLSHVGYSRPISKRPEIIIEGSLDGKKWVTYQFGWKPGLPTQSPRFASLYHPRLDWHLWFPLTGNSSYWIGSLLFNSPGQLSQAYEWKPEPSLINFVNGLKRNQPEIVALLSNNPFPNRPPRFIRLQLFDYHFSKMKERRKSGRWWNRRLLGSLDMEKEKLYPNPPPPPKVPVTPVPVVKPPVPPVKPQAVPTPTVKPIAPVVPAPVVPVKPNPPATPPQPKPKGPAGPAAGGEPPTAATASQTLTNQAPVGSERPINNQASPH